MDRSKQSLGQLFIRILQNEWKEHRIPEIIEVWTKVEPKGLKTIANIESDSQDETKSNSLMVTRLIEHSRIGHQTIQKHAVLPYFCEWWCRVYDIQLFLAVLFRNLYNCKAHFHVWKANYFANFFIPRFTITGILLDRFNSSKLLKVAWFCLETRLHASCCRIGS